MAQCQHDPAGTRQSQCESRYRHAISALVCRNLQNRGSLANICFPQLLRAARLARRVLATRRWWSYATAKDATHNVGLSRQRMARYASALPSAAAVRPTLASVTLYMLSCQKRFPVPEGAAFPTCRAIPRLKHPLIDGVPQPNGA
jgi:hypothetical protein